MLTAALNTLTEMARARGLTDSQWADRAGLRKETLSRLRGRKTCDLKTLQSLASAVGAQLGVLEGSSAGLAADGHFPAEVDRDYEERLARLCRSDDLDVKRWLGLGPAFFMAGLAVMLASADDENRRALLALAEQLHPGASEVAVFDRWLQRSPVRPSRFLPLLTAPVDHAS